MGRPPGPPRHPHQFPTCWPSLCRVPPKPRKMSPRALAEATGWWFGVKTPLFLKPNPGDGVEWGPGSCGGSWERAVTLHQERWGCDVLGRVVVGCLLEDGGRKGGWAAPDQASRLGSHPPFLSLRCPRSPHFTSPGGSRLPQTLIRPSPLLLLLAPQHTEGRAPHPRGACSVPAPG